MYQVGFGDSFLLSFDYGRQLSRRPERHVLIDCGSNRQAEGVSMERIVDLIGEHSGGKLDAIVLTHRHKDHMSAFGVDKTARLFDQLSPDLVVRPWTEDPKRPAAARGFLGALDRAQAFAEIVEKRIPPERRGLAGELRGFAAAQVKNKKAIDRLDRWAKAGRAAYLKVGDDARELERIVPGVGVRVLGPPTVEDWPDLLRERRSDPEYWMRLGGAVRSGRISFEAEIDEISELDLVPGGQGLSLAGAPAPGPVRWLMGRMRRQQTFVVHRLVRILDDMLNNTSLILQFDFGRHRMLFSGDAEVANWEYALRRHRQRAAILRDLRGVDLYKVGHHGSRNATPKLGLYAEWSPRPKGALTSLLSTKLGVYPGKTEATRVPRSSLVNALRRLGRLHGTHLFRRGQEYIELVAEPSRTGYRLG